MWKNLFDKKRINSPYYKTFTVLGLNQDRLINALAKNKIAVFSVKKHSAKKMELKVYAKDQKKAFAIIKELCYNVKKVENSGKFYPILSFFMRYGAVLGIAFFCFSAVYFNGFVFSIDYVGTGIKYKSQVQGFLIEEGINFGTRFSSFEIKELEDKILCSNDNLSFVSCEKVGSRLKITLVEADKKKSVLSGNVKKMVSDVDGTIESIRVYRGTANVNVGDKVKVGDTLVDGFATVGENVIEINVLASATVIIEYKEVYYSQNQGEEELALISAKGTLDSEILEERVDCIFDGQRYCYEVTFTLRHTILAG